MVGFGLTNLVVLSGSLQIRFSGLEEFYAAILYCLSLGRPQGVIRNNTHFGGPIEEKVSCLEGCYVAILYCLRVGRLGNAWIFKFGRALCSNSLLFEAWKA